MISDAGRHLWTTNVYVTTSILCVAFLLCFRWFEEGCMIWAQASQIGASQIKAPIGRVHEKYVYTCFHGQDKDQFEVFWWCCPHATLVCSLLFMSRQNVCIILALKWPTEHFSSPTDFPIVQEKQNKVNVTFWRFYWRRCAHTRLQKNSNRSKCNTHSLIAVDSPATH